MSTVTLQASCIDFLPAGNLLNEPESRFSAAAGENGNSDEETASRRFALFSKEWIDLQIYIQRALGLPVSGADFDRRYGSFEINYRQVIDGVVAAMQSVQMATKEFGSPKEIRDALAKDPDALADGKSTDLYARIVVLASQIESTASSFSYTIASLNELIGPHNTPEQRKANLREILAGEGGLITLADETHKATAALVTDLATFDRKLSAANVTLYAYTTPDTAHGQLGGQSLMAEVDRLIEDDAKTIDQVLLPAAKAARDSWIGLATGAGTGALLIAALTGGFLIPVAAAFGGTLGGVSEIFHKEYNDYLKQIQQKEQDKRQKNELKVDLAAFNHEIPKVERSLGKFVEQVQRIEAVWLATRKKFERMAKNDGLDAVIKMPAVNMVMHCNDAMQTWKDIARKTSEFTAHSLIQFRLQPFCTPVEA